MFYMDEMRVLGVVPDVDIFVSLFRACAMAPHWVNGYDDFIFDAMCRMEGAEIYPTTEVYNSVIYAFSRACDSDAAEFYFLEMRAKGLRHNVTTYNSLFNAYARAQSVGVKPYGYLGRYVRPEKKPVGKLQKAMMKIGAVNVAKIMTENLTMEGAGQGRKHRDKLVDLADVDPEAAVQSFDTEIKLAAMKVKGPTRFDDPDDEEEDAETEELLESTRRSALEAELAELDLEENLEGGEGGDDCAIDDDDDDEEFDFEAMLKGDKRMKSLIEGLSEDDIIQVEDLFKKSNKMADAAIARRKTGQMIEEDEISDENFEKMMKDLEGKLGEADDSEEDVNSEDVYVENADREPARKKTPEELIGNPFASIPTRTPKASVNKTQLLRDQFGNFLLIYISNFHVLNHLLLIYICKLHWNQ